MKILAHRGLWFKKDERNTLSALYRALDEGYGLETDIRDLNGELVISHNMPNDSSVIFLEQLLRYYADEGFTSTLGLNIKSDGLQSKLSQQLEDHNIENYFVFDMSVPDTLGYLKVGMRTFIRRSDLEYHPELTLQAQGVWLDELIEPWINSKVVLKEAKQTDTVCIVSSEIHGREYAPQWNAINKAFKSDNFVGELLICTDLPHKAERFFK